MTWTKEQIERFKREDKETLGATTSYDDWTHEDDLQGGLNIVSPSFRNLAKQWGFEDTWIAGGFGRYGFYVGYWCGKDRDLICSLPLRYKETEELDPYLSPEGKTPQEALNLAIKKRRRLLKFIPREDLDNRYRLIRGVK